MATYVYKLPQEERPTAYFEDATLLQYGNQIYLPHG